MGIWDYNISFYLFGKWEDNNNSEKYLLRREVVIKSFHPRSFDLTLASSASFTVCVLSEREGSSQKRKKEKEKKEESE